MTFNVEEIEKLIKTEEIEDSWYIGGVKVTAGDYETEIWPLNEVPEDCYFSRSLGNIFYKGVNAAVAVINKLLEETND